MKAKHLTSSENAWLLPGAAKDQRSITADWQFVSQNLIEGVRLKEVRHVPKQNGYLTEVYRKDWDLDEFPVDQVFQVTLDPGKISAWHSHATTIDRIFVNQGTMKIVLYDARTDSPTYGQINEFRFGMTRPTLILIPPKVWHGIQNLASEPSSILNLVDEAYQYEDPDHWRLPWDSDHIPYRFISPSETDSKLPAGRI